MPDDSPTRERRGTRRTKNNLYTSHEGSHIFPNSLISSPLAVQSFPDRERGGRALDVSTDRPSLRFLPDTTEYAYYSPCPCPYPYVSEATVHACNVPCACRTTVVCSSLKKDTSLSCCYSRSLHVYKRPSFLPLLPVGPASAYTVSAHSACCDTFCCC
jgi:hypothetical protein